MLGAAGQPVLERAIVAPDPQRPYVQAALVRIDMRYARLHLVAGTQEPASRARLHRPGSIPPGDQGIRNDTRLGGASTRIAVKAAATTRLSVSWLCTPHQYTAEPPMAISASNVRHLMQ